METINNIELRDENTYPDEIVLNNILGEAYSVYMNLLELFQKYEMNFEWRYYHDGKAWLCKVQKKEKNDCLDVCLERLYASYDLLSLRMRRKSLGT